MSSERNLLAILDTNPFPASDGKTYPIEGHLKGLAEWWNIDILEVRKANVSHGFETGTHRTLARHVMQVQAPPPANKLSKLTGELLGGRPYFLNPVSSNVQLKTALRDRRYDAIYVSPVGLVEWAKETAKILPQNPVLVLNQNDSLTERFRRDYDLFKLRVLTLKNSAKHLCQSLRVNYMAKLEKRIYSDFDLVLVQTEADRKAILKDVGGEIDSKLLLAPNGIKESLLELEYQQQSLQRLLHIGGLSRNRRDLVFWFLKEVFLPVREKLPQMTIQLAGSISPADRVLLEQMPGVEPIGFVQDVERVLSQATMSIAPLFMRSGLVNKVLDSMAAAVPASGAKAFNGFPGFVDGVHGFNVNDATQWQDVLLKTLSDPELLTNVSAAGRRLVVENLRWQSTIQRLHRKLSQLVDDQRHVHNARENDESLVA